MNLVRADSLCYYGTDSLDVVFETALLNAGASSYQFIPALTEIDMLECGNVPTPCTAFILNPWVKCGHAYSVYAWGSLLPADTLQYLGCDYVQDDVWD